MLDPDGSAAALWQGRPRPAQWTLRGLGRRDGRRKIRRLLTRRQRSPLINLSSAGSAVWVGGGVSEAESWLPFVRRCVFKEPHAIRTDAARVRPPHDRGCCVLGGSGPSGRPSPSHRRSRKPFTGDQILDDGHPLPRRFVVRAGEDVVQEAGRRWGLPKCLRRLGTGAVRRVSSWPEPCAASEGKCTPAMPETSRSIGRDRRSGFMPAPHGDRTMRLVYNLPALDAVFRSIRRCRGGVPNIFSRRDRFTALKLGPHRSWLPRPLRWRRRATSGSMSSYLKSPSARPGVHSDGQVQSQTAFEVWAALTEYHLPSSK